MSKKSKNEKNKNLLSKDESRINNFLPELEEILNRLHKYLPDEFPDINVLENYPGIFEAHVPVKYYIQSDTRNEGVRFVSQGFQSKFAYEIHLLWRFFKQYDKEKEPKLWIAGLPWRFSSRAFYQKYCAILGHKNTAEMLLAMRVKKETINKYKRSFKDIVRKDKFESFQEDFKNYVISKKKIGRSYTIDEVLKNIPTQVTKADLKEWDSKNLFGGKIEIFWKAKRIKYWKSQTS